MRLNKFIIVISAFFIMVNFHIHGVSAERDSKIEEVTQTEEENIKLPEDGEQTDKPENTEEDLPQSQAKEETPQNEEETQKLKENDIEDIGSDTEEDSPEELSNEGSAETTNQEEVEETEEIESQHTNINVYSLDTDLPYKKGDDHEDIIPVKEKLNALGFDGIATISGNFGSHTERRVKEFQEYYGLVVTGEVDQVTLEKLEKVYNTPYQSGKTNDYTTEIKVMLNALGYSGLAEGPVFGNLTEKRVTEFQDAYGLKTHGIADDPTIAMLSNAYNDLNSNEFKRGDEHATVTEIKVKLNKLGFSGLAEGPVFGSLTETRVKEFQEYYGISVTGIADEQTQNKLDEIYNTPYQNGKSHDYTTEIKVMLNALGYNGLAEGPVFGNLTEKRIKKFQSDYELQVHGIADDPTIETLTNAYDSLQNEFKLGDEHAAVIEIKMKLNRLGFSGLAEGPVFGSLTKTRVKEFQEYYGIPVTEIADEQTQNKLDEIYNSPYQNGKSSSYMTEVKKKLNGLGFDGLAEGPVFGNLTEKRVKEFQQDRGLKAHGIIDEPTITVLNDAYNQMEFQKGDYHPTVIKIKQHLNRLGFDGLALTGNFGKFTETRVKQFQSYYGLPSTGVADLETQEKIDEVYNSPYQKGKTNSFITDIKMMLSFLDYKGLANGPVYGSLTETRIKQFQNDYNLQAHGIADEITIKKLESEFNSVSGILKKGDRKPEVIELKKKLNSLGYNGLAITDNFGSFTETRVKEFQRDNNLPVTGIADERTLQKIRGSFNVTIFIDPGHGAGDSGGTGYGLREKDVVLDIGRKVAEELNNYKGVNTVLSRSNDTFLGLGERTKLANNLGVDYFVSLHTNAHTGSASGFETYIYNGSVSQETRNRQRDLHTHLANWLRSNGNINDRGMKRANFHVVRETIMPAILIEYMFIDNRRENNLLSNLDYRNSLGRETAEAIANSFNLKKK